MLINIFYVTILLIMYFDSNVSFTYNEHADYPDDNDFEYSEDETEEPLDELLQRLKRYQLDRTYAEPDNVLNTPDKTTLYSNTTFYDSVRLTAVTNHEIFRTTSSVEYVDPYISAETFTEGENIYDKPVVNDADPAKPYYHKPVEPFKVKNILINSESATFKAAPVKKYRHTIHFTPHQTFIATDNYDLSGKLTSLEDYWNDFFMRITRLRAPREKENLYDQPMRIVKTSITSTNEGFITYISNEYEKALKKIYQFVPNRTEMRLRPYQTSSKDIVSLSRSKILDDYWSEIMQSEPKRSKYKFAPHIAPEVSRNDVFLKKSKPTDYFWSEIMQTEPRRSKTKFDPLIPREEFSRTTNLPVDYWSEFMEIEPRRTKTVSHKIKSIKTPYRINSADNWSELIDIEPGRTKTVPHIETEIGENAALLNKNVPTHEYWSEILQNELRRTKTASTSQIPTTTSKTIEFSNRIRLSEDFWRDLMDIEPRRIKTLSQEATEIAKNDSLLNKVVPLREYWSEILQNELRRTKIESVSHMPSPTSKSREFPNSTRLSEDYLRELMDVKPRRTKTLSQEATEIAKNDSLLNKVVPLREYWSEILQNELRRTKIESVSHVPSPTSKSREFPNSTRLSEDYLMELMDLEPRRSKTLSNIANKFTKNNAILSKISPRHEYWNEILQNELRRTKIESVSHNLTPTSTGEEFLNGTKLSEDYLRELMDFEPRRTKAISQKATEIAKNDSLLNQVVPLREYWSEILQKLRRNKIESVSHISIPTSTSEEFPNRTRLSENYWSDLMDVEPRRTKTFSHMVTKFSKEYALFSKVSPQHEDWNEILLNELRRTKTESVSHIPTLTSKSEEFPNRTRLSKDYWSDFMDVEPRRTKTWLPIGTKLAKNNELLNNIPQYKYWNEIQQNELRRTKTESVSHIPILTSKSQAFPNRNRLSKDYWSDLMDVEPRRTKTWLHIGTKLAKNDAFLSKILPQHEYWNEILQNELRRTKTESVSHIPTLTSKSEEFPNRTRLLKDYWSDLMEEEPRRTKILSDIGIKLDKYDALLSKILPQHEYWNEILQNELRRTKTESVSHIPTLTSKSEEFPNRTRLLKDYWSDLMEEEPRRTKTLSDIGIKLDKYDALLSKILPQHEYWNGILQNELRRTKTESVSHIPTPTSKSKELRNRTRLSKDYWSNVMDVEPRRTKTWLHISSKIAKNGALLNKVVPPQDWTDILQNELRRTKIESTSHLPTPTFEIKEFFKHTKLSDEYWNEIIDMAARRTMNDFISTKITDGNINASEDYWNEFMQIEPSRPTENIPDATTANNVIAVDTMKAPDDYWNEFMQVEPRKTKGSDAPGWQDFKKIFEPNNLSQLINIVPHEGQDDYWHTVIHIDPEADPSLISKMRQGFKTLWPTTILSVITRPAIDANAISSEGPASVRKPFSLDLDDLKSLWKVYLNRTSMQPTVTSFEDVIATQTSYEPIVGSRGSRTRIRPTVTFSEPFMATRTLVRPTTTSSEPFIRTRIMLKPTVTTFEPFMGTRTMYWPTLTTEKPLMGTRTVQKPTVTSTKPFKGTRTMYRPTLTTEKPLMSTRTVQKPTVTSAKPFMGTRTMYWPTLTTEKPLMGTRTVQKPTVTSTKPFMGTRTMYWPTLTTEKPFMGSRTVQKPTVTSTKPFMGTRTMYWPTLTTEKPFIGTRTKIKPTFTDFEPIMATKTMYWPTFTTGRPFMATRTIIKPTGTSLEPFMGTRTMYWPTLTTEEPFTVTRTVVKPTVTTFEPIFGTPTVIKPTLTKFEPIIGTRTIMKPTTTSFDLNITRTMIRPTLTTSKPHMAIRTRLWPTFTRLETYIDTRTRIRPSLTTSVSDMSTRTRLTPSFTNLNNLSPTRTTRRFNWNFNDDKKADVWPIIEILLPTSSKSIKETTKSKKTIKTYFNLYWSATRPTVTQTISSALNTSNSSAIKKILREPPEHFFEYEQAKCYTCGMNISGLPMYPTCHHVFSAKTPQMKLERVKLKEKCPSVSVSWTGANPPRPYRGGCFHRWVDVGEIFDERGCRFFPPTLGQTIIAKRLRALEFCLWHVDTGCTKSPMAVLTPFNRAISLWARYHVCVCRGKYCNDARKTNANVLIFLITIIFNILLSI